MVRSVTMTEAPEVGAEKFVVEMPLTATGL